MPTEYSLKRRVHFYETDLAGIVHFSCFFRNMEEAEHALWREAGLSIAPAGEIGWPREAASFDFHRYLKFEDEFEILVRVTAVTVRTISYACVLTRGETRIAGNLTIACVSKRPNEPMKSIPIPPEIAARFSS